MPDVHELIESIRVMLASAMEPKREELSELHDQLDEYIRLANKRLRECDGLLANGHRSEAIQLAEQEPNLLEFVGILDFPELPEWNDFIAEAGLKVTPEIQIDIATDLNHAYSDADDTPLERWLNKLRVYSIGRAPLKQRMEILRKIAKIDVESPHWFEDIKAYEQVRQRQMQEEFRTAAERNDYERLADLYTEVTKTKWTQKPQKAFVQKLTNSLGSLHQQHAFAKLREVYRALRLAEEEDNIKAAERAIGLWEKTIEECDPHSPDVQDLEQRVAPIFDWVNSHHDSQEAEEEKKRELEKLKRLIRSPRSTIDALEARYEYITEDGYQLPEALYEQYLDRIEEIENQADMQRKLKFIGIGVGILVLLIAAIVALF